MPRISRGYLVELFAETGVIRNSLGVVSTDGVRLENNIAAASGAQQMSPRIRFQGQGWKTDATAASQAVDFKIELLPIEGTANPSSRLVLGSSINGGAYTEVFGITSGGIVFVNDTANGGMTIGLTLNQGASDNQALAIKSSDVATVLTTITGTTTETDDYFTVQKHAATTGGVLIQGLGENAAVTVNFRLESYGGQADTTKSTAGRGLVEVYASQHDGANALANIAADGNVFAVRGRRGAADVALAIVDEDGDLWLGGSITATSTTFTGAISVTVAALTATFTNSNDGASSQVAIFQGDRATPADNDAAYITLRLSDSAGNQDEGARITWQATTVLDGATQDTDLILSAVVNGSLTTFLTLDGSANRVLFTASANPVTNNAAALGEATVSWADLFLATGGVINWANGEVTITETDADTLTVAGTTLIDIAAGIMELNNAVRFDTGVAIVAASYSIGRDADGTNQLHLNVPTGAGFEFSVNDVAEVTLSATTLALGTNNVTLDGTITFGVASDIIFAAATAAALELSDGTTKFYAIDSRVATASVTTHALDISDYTIASGATNVATGWSLAAHTLNYTGATQVTTQVDTVVIGARTIAGDTATLTVDEANTLLLVAPLEGTNVAITAAAALRIVNAGGTPVNQYGIYIEALTVGATSDVGIYIAGADTYAMHVASAAPVRLGLAGTGTGVLQFVGTTSGVVTMSVAAAAGTWTMQLPAAVAGLAGDQLTDAAANGVCSWAAVASLREYKDVLGPGDKQDALKKILSVPVSRYHYREDARSSTRDFETEYMGVMAEDAPWAMHYKGRILNPANTFGYTTLAIQALYDRIAMLEAKLAMN